MAIKFQYNKTSLQELEKSLKMRVYALPIIKNKESALRMEVKKAKDEIIRLEQEVEQRITAYDQMLALWGEFDTTLLRVEDVKMNVKKIAGVRIPVLEEVIFTTRPFSLFNAPKWYADGLTQLKELAQVSIEHEFSAQKVQLLEFARKKTTQKVNLFEKVQIPGYEDAILKIKRFMEDEENLSKSLQKIIKAKREAEALKEAGN
ncbi:MAG: V-type ATP synthase subunit D [Paludibacteraceae bacterium]|jgi:V/A-type H+-transporting ATPase subunit D|nr:V-type ATP synthase subunit D [Paludibacteraceae bacterium]MDI9536848.1 V-type ATP synthase subunit D [Bacteroidota bacterium]HHT61580.1 V-type ATP synthase subunit D [Bacteroidales bacterium]MBP9039369.1 V-type ATP synthase subunit D [Paludibacteraceae bacterium]HOO24484.1 V-type ATP synthase subunit D [Paludibacteraceae bacterium]